LKVEDGIAKCFGCDRLYVEQDGKVQPMSNEIPVFKSVDEMMKFAAKAKGGKVNPQSPNKKTSRKRKPAEADASKKLLQETPQAPVYKTLHFYVRPGDSWEQVLKDCREEVSYAGPGTLIFAHNHLHGAPCTDACRGMN
jgi:hypothetical protein